MAKIVRKNTLTSEKHAIKNAYELFIRSRKSQCSDKSVKLYQDMGNRNIIPDLIEYTDDDMNKVDANVIRAVVDDYGETHGKGGVFFYYRHIKVFINWYWDEFEPPAPNPMRKAKYKKAHTPPKQGITREEVDKLLKTAKTSEFPERDTAMLMILCDTGIRLSSLIGIKIKDVNTNKAELLVFEKDQQYHIKGLGTNCNKAVKRYLNCIEDVEPDASFWWKMDGTQLTEAGMKQALRRLCRDAEIPLHLFHDFRRFYGLELYKSTHDIYFVSRALDHKDIEVTKRYLAIDQLEDAEIIRTVSPMDNGAATVKIKRK